MDLEEVYDMDSNEVKLAQESSRAFVYLAMSLQAPEKECLNQLSN
jgi:hypothetical protein